MKASIFFLGCAFHYVLVSDLIQLLMHVEGIPSGNLTRLDDLPITIKHCIFNAMLD